MRTNTASLARVTRLSRNAGALRGANRRARHSILCEFVPEPRVDLAIGLPVPDARHAKAGSNGGVRRPLSAVKKC